MHDNDLLEFLVQAVRHIAGLSVPITLPGSDQDQDKEFQLIASGLTVQWTSAIMRVMSEFDSCKRILVDCGGIQGRALCANCTMLALFPHISFFLPRTGFFYDCR